MAIQGTCHICGKFGELSFEHVPPNSAFNDHPIVHYQMHQLMNQSDSGQRIRGKIRQKGAGEYTLCPSCNNRTGRFYGEAYAEWAKQGLEAINAARGQPEIFYPFLFRPLCVIKQIMCMFCSINGTRFREKYPSVERFVMDRDAKLLPPELRVYAFYAIGPVSRSVGVAGTMRGFVEGTPSTRIFSELTYPPFGYVLSYNSPPPDDQFLDITYFSRFNYVEVRKDYLRFPVRPVFTYFPGDYRAPDKVAKDAAIALGDWTSSEN